MQYNKGYTLTSDDTAVRERLFERSLWRNVYLWMALGLGLTTSVAYFSAATPSIRAMLMGQNAFFLMIGLSVGTVALAMNLSFRLQKMSMKSAVFSYVAFTIIQGVLLFSIFLFYPTYILIKTFLTASSMFLVMSLWGAFSKQDLSPIGKFCMMAVWGILIATLINFFFRSTGMHYIISFIGVFAFAGLTAYDTQKISRMSKEMSENIDEVNFVKLSIMGALILYLDFINLFLFLLRIFGGGRRD
ncbi:MAG: Bax inhibitor-1/YccA family protein [Spirochaetia bacterium]